MTGTPANVEKAKLALGDKIVEMEKEKEDRVLRYVLILFMIVAVYSSGHKPSHIISLH